MKPNVSVGVCFVLAILLVGGVAVYALYDALHEKSVFGGVAGLLLILFVLWLSAVATEGGSLRLDEEGIRQRRVIYKQRFFAEQRIKWNEVSLVLQDGFVFTLRGNDGEILLNLANFRDWNEVIMFMNQRLPSGVRRAEK